jgi:histidinol-phosphate aminotransferase
VLAAVFSVRDEAVPVEPDGSLPVDFARHQAALRFVVNPNSPTGLWISPEDLEVSLREANGVVVIDEAYCDFAPASCVPLLSAHANWLIVRTLSKSYALAGLRVGYAVGDAALIDDLNAVRDSYPVDRCAIAGAIAAVEDHGHHRLIVDTVLRERARMSERLRALGWTVVPSHANFVFASPPSGVRAARVAARLRESRILVRHFSLPGLDEALRITVGDGPATDRVLAAISVLDGEALSGT